MMMAKGGFMENCVCLIVSFWPFASADFCSAQFSFSVDWYGWDRRFNDFHMDGICTETGLCCLFLLLFPFYFFYLAGFCLYGSFFASQKLVKRRKSSKQHKRVSWEPEAAKILLSFYQKGLVLKIANQYNSNIYIYMI
ncbi:hypothetical protein QBC43DRAFT_308281 [Cladorrhinum sp. PSN259]|nr:hypothetical protein QBC43DRAFT_308281 [Cladorrhinum sp. PSN259]